MYQSSKIRLRSDELPICATCSEDTDEHPCSRKPQTNIWFYVLTYCQFYKGKEGNDNAR